MSEWDDLPAMPLWTGNKDPNEMRGKPSRCKPGYKLRMAYSARKGVAKLCFRKAAVSPAAGPPTLRKFSWQEDQ